MTIVKVLNIDGIRLPKYETELSAGVDLTVTSFKKLYSGDKEIDISLLQRSVQNGYLTMRAWERLLVGTGLFLEIPPGYELDIRTRSGYALKKGLLVANSPGTVDAKTN